MSYYTQNFILYYHTNISCWKVTGTLPEQEPKTNKLSVYTNNLLYESEMYSHQNWFYGRLLLQHCPKLPPPLIFKVEFIFNPISDRILTLFSTPSKGWYLSVLKTFDKNSNIYQNFHPLFFKCYFLNIRSGTGCHEKSIPQILTKKYCIVFVLQEKVYFKILKKVK